MSVIFPNINTGEKHFAVCKKCNRPTEFQVVEVATSLVLKQIKYHQKYIAVCLKCNTVYNLPKSIGKDILCGKAALNNSFMQEKKPKEK